MRTPWTDEPTDPATHAARSLATTIAAFRDLLTDPAYASLLPAFQTLADALPQNVAVPGPRGEWSMALDVEPDPLDASS